MTRAIVLLSGGLDSATTLLIAKQEGFEVFALSFDYGQRHRVELERARQLAALYGAREHRVIALDFPARAASALTDPSKAVPKDSLGEEAIPVTYVPARNTLFLALALGWAEALGARDIYIGVNAVDYSGYPDCRPEFIRAFQALSRLATKSGVESGKGFRIHTPLIRWSKARIIRRGTRLGVDYALTVSCYQADARGRACGQCDSCRLRRDGFAAAGLPDPTRYA